MAFRNALYCFVLLCDCYVTAMLLLCPNLLYPSIFYYLNAKTISDAVSYTSHSIGISAGYRASPISYAHSHSFPSGSSGFASNFSSGSSVIPSNLESKVLNFSNSHLAYFSSAADSKDYSTVQNARVYSAGAMHNAIPQHVILQHASYSSTCSIPTWYGSTHYAHASYSINPKSQYSFIPFAPEDFTTGFSLGYAASDSEINPILEECFFAITGQSLPDNISIHVLESSEFRSIQMSLSGKWHPGVRGLSLNANGKGASEIFIEQGPIELVTVVAGHEIGHVITPTLKDKTAEEAKAFAFTIAWIEAIKQNNIRNMTACVKIPEPARNGLHDKALMFVIAELLSGISPINLFKKIAAGLETGFQRLGEIGLAAGIAAKQPTQALSAL